MLISLFLASGIEGSDDDALVTGEQDEELSRWEQEQIRKGINIPQVRRQTSGGKQVDRLSLLLAWSGPQ